MLRRTATYVVIYVVAIVLGRATAQPETGLALMWPAAGIAVLWTVRAASRREVVLASVLIGVLAAAGNGLTGFPVAAALVLGASNVVASLLTRFLVGAEVRQSASVAVHRLSHFYRLLGAGAAGTAVSAAVGMCGIALAGVPVTWGTSAGWWLRNMAAIVVIAAPALTLGGRRTRLTRAVVVEASAIYLITALTVVAVFGPGQALPLAFVPLALVVWAGLRLPLPFAAVEGGLIAVGALAMLRLTGGGPFGAIDDPATRALVLQAFMMLAATLAMVLATVHAELDEVVEGLAVAGRRAEEAADELREHVEILGRERERSDRLMSDAPYGIVVVALDGRILQANRAMAEMFDCSLEDIVGSAAAAFSTRPPEEVAEYLARTAAAAGAAVTTDWATHSITGRPLHLALSSRLLTSRSGGDELIVNVVDVSERRRYEERLSHLASTDALTGLPNRRHFEDVLGRHQARCEQEGPRGALLLLDLDHFKDVNDTLGHAAGDRLITSVAAVLRDVLRSSDTVARLGGDEFAVLLPDADLAAAETVAATTVTRIREHCAALDGAHRQVSASVGVVTFAAAADRGEDVLALADVLMYEAKTAGRDGYAAVGAAPVRRGQVAAAVRTSSAPRSDRHDATKPLAIG